MQRSTGKARRAHFASALKRARNEPGAKKVIVAKTNLDIARADLRRAQTDYANAITRLRFAEATLLDSYNLKIATDRGAGMQKGKADIGFPLFWINTNR